MQAVQEHGLGPLIRLYFFVYGCRVHRQLRSIREAIAPARYAYMAGAGLLRQALTATHAIYSLLVC